MSEFKFKDVKYKKVDYHNLSNTEEIKEEVKSDNINTEEDRLNSLLGKKSKNKEPATNKKEVKIKPKKVKAKTQGSKKTFIIIAILALFIIACVVVVISVLNTL